MSPSRKKTKPGKVEPVVSKSSGKNPTVEMVRQLARIFNAYALSELEIETKEANITLRRGEKNLPTLIQHGPALASAVHTAPLAASVAPSAEVSVEKEASSVDLHVVTTPFVGTFYRAPNPESSPYVQVGDRVKPGQVLCIVEAMKLMNEIETEESGIVSDILVENGEPVEYGQALFKLSST